MLQPSIIPDNENVAMIYGSTLVLQVEPRAASILLWLSVHLSDLSAVLNSQLEPLSKVL